MFDFSEDFRASFRIRAWWGPMRSLPKRYRIDPDRIRRRPHAARDRRTDRSNGERRDQIRRDARSDEPVRHAYWPTWSPAMVKPKLRGEEVPSIEMESQGSQSRPRRLWSG